MIRNAHAMKNKKPLQILLVEDNAADAGLLREMFGKERPDVRLGLQLRLSANHYDVVLAGDGVASIDLPDPGQMN